MVIANMAYNPPVPNASTVATASSLSPKSNPSVASSTVNSTALCGAPAAVTRLRTAGILPSRAMENTIRDVYWTMDDPQARNAIMTIARNGVSAQAPKLSTITGVTGSDAALVCCKVSRLKLRVSAAELKSTTLPTMQREKKIARGTIRLGS